MFRGDLIIDGYNLLHAGTFALSNRPGALEQARLELLELIASKLTSRERQRTTVVFDAPLRVMGSSTAKRFHGLSVVFADADGDADVTIERLIRQNSAPRRLCIVSSDHRLQRAARRRKARFLDSDVFLARLVRRESQNSGAREDPEQVRKREGLPPAEVDAWLRVFHGSGEHISELELREALNSSESDMPADDSHVDGAPPSPIQPASTSSSDEVTFWEKRVAELDDENQREKCDRD